MDNKILLEQYKLDMIGLHGVSEAGMKAYLYKINNFAGYIEVSLDQAGEMEIRDFLLALKKAKQAINTQRGTITAIRSFYGWLQQKHKVSDPSRNLHSLKEEVRIPNLISTQDVERMIVAAGQRNWQKVSGVRCQVTGSEQSRAEQGREEQSISKLKNATNEEEIFATFSRLRNAAIICLFADTGIRRGELQALRVGDVQQQEKQFILQVSGEKTYTQRMIPFSYLEEGSLVAETWCAYWQMVKYVKQWTGEDYLFQREAISTKWNKETGKYEDGKEYHWGAGPMTTQNIHQIVKQAAVKAGLNNANRISPHTLRHFFATSLAMDGINITIIQKRLGHASLDRTQIYIHYADIQKSDSAKNNPMSRSKGSIRSFVKMQKEILQKGTGNREQGTAQNRAENRGKNAK